MTPAAEGGREDCFAAGNDTRRSAAAAPHATLRQGGTEPPRSEELDGRARLL
ncbi:MAG: hypothetical protein AAFU80_04190 [Pseudomonadota bacterium]